MPQNNPLIPLPIPLCNPKLLKAALNVFVAEQQVLDDPRDLIELSSGRLGLVVGDATAMVCRRRW
jgi:hypothetical protein